MRLWTPCTATGPGSTWPATRALWQHPALLGSRRAGTGPRPVCNVGTPYRGMNGPNTVVAPQYSSTRLYCALLSRVVPCHNTVAVLPQYCATILWQSCHNTVAVLPQYCGSLATILWQYCHNTVAVLPQYCGSTATILWQYCHNTVVAPGSTRLYRARGVRLLGLGRSATLAPRTGV
jgi:hypothetical protein